MVDTAVNVYVHTIDHWYEVHSMTTTKNYIKITLKYI